MKRAVNLSIFCLAIFFLATLGCKKDDSPAPVKDKPSPSEIDQFIWKGLHTYYLWVKDVQKLSYKYFNNNTDELDSFLLTYTDHEKLFYDLLYQYGKVDKFSWIVDDYEELENMFQGISKSMGYDFRLVRINNSNDLFGFVRYVVKGSPADLAGMKRGDIFIKVNDQQLTISNYESLLINSESYKLSFATISNATIAPKDKSVNLTAVVLEENPIFFDTVYNINNYKVGYLVYNSFTSKYDLQLNQVFNNFKSKGVNKLILDLRYNGGGSINTAIYLSSMIYTTDITKCFVRMQFNDSVQNELKKKYGDDYFDNYFTGTIATSGTSKTQINTLNLSDLYVITTDNTASASELVINGLDAYITVIKVGSNTYGKYVGSITLKDEDSRGNVNPKHKWAMQPIVLKLVNSEGVSDYVDGFAPDIVAEEDIANLIPFGNENEPMLKAALDAIKGVSQQKMVLKSHALGMQKFADSKDFIPFSKEMYINDNILKSIK